MGCGFVGMDLGFERVLDGYGLCCVVGLSVFF